MNENDGFMITGKTYDLIKRVVQVVLPAFSSAYFGLAAIWNLPAAEQVVGTTAILTTFLGVILGISSKNYENSDKAYEGDMVVTTTPEGGTLYSLEANGDLGRLKTLRSVRFKVVPQELPPEIG